MKMQYMATPVDAIIGISEGMKRKKILNTEDV